MSLQFLAHEIFRWKSGELGPQRTMGGRSRDHKEGSGIADRFVSW